MNSGHVSVLSEEVGRMLALEPNHIVVDATTNGGGHSEHIIKHLDERGVLLGIDMDREALAFARERLAGATCTVVLKEGNNRHLDAFLMEAGIARVDRFLYDLGMSSRQLDAGGRGFSFNRDEPLLMTFKTDPGQEDITAFRIVNEWDEAHVADILYGYGEERFARRIARRIVEARRTQPITTTEELVAVVRDAVPVWYRHGRRHFATRTFQALRIAVNDEVRSLEESLRKAREALAPKGRIIVITFHSIEDRIVKRTFKSWQDEGFGTVIGKKPIAPTEAEISRNPRSRSAKLRVFESR